MSLSASPSQNLITQSITLTATTAYDVQPTPFAIQIFDLGTRSRIAVCGSGTTCSVSASQVTPQCRGYVADVAPAATSYPPATISAESNRVTARWYVVSSGGCGR